MIEKQLHRQQNIADNMLVTAKAAIPSFNLSLTPFSSKLWNTEFSMQSQKWIPI